MLFLNALFYIQALYEGTKDTNWGLFAEHDPISLKQASIVMLAFIAMFFAFPALNYVLKRKVEKEEVFIDTQVELKENLKA